MAHAFFLGVDVADHEDADDPGAVTLTLLEKEQNGDHTARYRLDSIRHESDVSEPGSVADHIQSLVADSPYIGRTTLIVNCRSDVGQAIADALDDRGLAPVEARLTGGMGATAGDTDEVGVNVSEYDAVEALATLYRDGRLTFEEHASSGVSRLARGIQSFVEVLTDVEEATEAPDTVAAEPQRPEAFDNHVTSAALAAWIGTERSFDPSQRLKSELRSRPSDL